MSAIETTCKVIGLWLDGEMGCLTPGETPSWIVSRDRMNADGEAVTTDTVEAFPADDYDDAREAALALARKDGLCVIETRATGQECIYAPKQITISDVGCTVEYLLYGDTLEQTVAGGCRDGLNDDGCRVDDGMDDDEIIDAVRDCWIDGCTENMGEEYDADANRLSVTVGAVRSIID